MRIRYRARQFFGGLLARVTEADRREAEAVLPPLARAWFRSLPRDVQWHGLQVMQGLKRLGIDRPDVLAAALLHDAGKAEAASGPLQRAMLVLARRLAPEWVRQRSWIDWQAARGIDRVVAVAQQHPQIGAEMAQRCGCDPITIDLIRRHQERAGAGDAMLIALQHVDDRS